ncbi:hypothetical protein SLEP1_g56672 [Rubroshorea leprosula]|uniref:AAA+ ATPase domain-containing protein n=1 Tax=Rubroshorea leprosula TaxID=152421 RepID=A0AAV5MJ65_9ROSI|nr:hypothetical protein SLEP1_g56672 [Rubroshorea leprosula]
MASLLPSTSTLLSAYASLSTAITLIRTILCQMIPNLMRDYLISSKLFESLSLHFSPNFTFIIEDRWQAVDNEVFRAVEVYLPTRISPSSDPHNPEQNIAVSCKIIDEFQGMKLEWSLRSIEAKKYFHRESRYIRLTCKKSHRERVMQSYFPHIASTAQTIMSKRENLYIYTYDDKEASRWKSTVFMPTATFDSLAMEPKRKQDLINDLDTFVGRKEFFQRSGRVWKRGYLLHGPPGTGKSSLVAAIANHMRYNIYDLQLHSIRSDAELKRILTSTRKRSILLVEDIDCSPKVARDRPRIRNEQEEQGEEEQTYRLSPPDAGVPLSGLLNLIDGLWSSGMDERIIIFTTKHKDKLEPTLLWPGRIDVDVYMGYCTPEGFRQLADAHLQIKDHYLFAAIEDLLKKVSVTPAEVAHQLLNRGKPQAILDSFIEYLEMKRNGIEEAN